MDWSCGLGALATKFETPFLVGPGPIKSIENLTIGGTRYLCILSGNRIYTSTASTIDDLLDFTLLRDFGPLAAPPPAPTVAPFGPTGATSYQYRVAVVGGPPSSAVSLAGTIANGNATLATGVTEVWVSWTAFIPGAAVTVFRSLDGGATWEQRTMGAGVTTLHDDGSLWSAFGPTASLPSASTGQTPYQLLAASPMGISRLWVGVDSGGFWAWDGASWQQSVYNGRALTTEGFHFLRSSNVATPTPGLVPNNFVYDNTLEPIPVTPAPANWIIKYHDERPSEITRILRLNEALLVFAESRIGLAGTAADNITDLTPDRGLPANANNGRSACVWQGSVYAPFGMGLYKITPTSATSATVEPVGMERLIENDAPVQGRITALAPWGPWHLFWAAYNEREGEEGTAYIGKYGAWVNPEAVHDPNSQLIPVLHGALESWPGRQITWMQHSTIGEPSGNGRLYVGFDNGGLAWTILPGQTPFAPNDPFCRFRSTGFTVLSRHSMGFQADDKNYFDLTGFGPVVTNTQRIRFSYQLPEDTAWRDIPGEVTEGGEPLVFPEGAQGKWIQLMVTMETDVPVDSPVIEGVALGEQLRPSSIEEISFTAHVGPRLIRRDGHVTRASAKELHDLLRRLEAKGDDVRVLLPDGQEERAAINDFTDRYLEGSTTMGPRHDMSLTLLTFKTVS